jgi:hypothetical protein
MNDPERLIDERANDFTGELLRAVHRDAPSPHARERTLVALGIGGGLTGVSASVASAASAGALAKGATATTVVLVVKWAGIGATTAAIVLGGAREIPKHLGKANEAPSIAVKAAEVSPPPPVPALRREPVRELATSEPQALDAPRVLQPQALDAPRVLQAPPPIVRDRDPAAAPPALATSSPRSEQDLAQELALLDRAGRAIAERDVAGALFLLDTYQAKFPQGTMEPEAVVLRIEALRAGNQKAAARRLAQDFLTSHPKSPHTKRMQGLLDDASNW